MRKTVLEFFTYNDWANEQIIGKLLSVENPPQRCISLISHIISAQDVWYERLTGSPDYQITLWDDYTLNECKILSQQSSEVWLKLIRNVKNVDFSRLVEYKTETGHRFEAAFTEVALHVANHSNYHRGQINSLLSSNGFEPAKIDFIYFTAL